MDTSASELIPVIINSSILLFLSAVFSGAETAFTNLTPARAEMLRTDGKFASKLVYKLYRRLDMVISLSLILSNGVNIFLATYLAIFFTGLFGVELGGLLSATVGTVLVILFGEIIPKKFAILFPVTGSRVTAHLLEFCRIIIYPVLVPVLLINRGLDRLKKQDKEETREVMHEEIKATLGIGHSEGALEKKEYQMMNQLLLLKDKEVSHIMRHRNEIVAIKADKTLRALVKLTAKHNISRVPVYNESLDDIEYIVHTPQLTAQLLQPANLERPVADFCAMKALKVPESMLLDDLFFEFQEKRLHMAIVLDEYGQTSGLITLEDIVEQIFGDIEDESDDEDDSIIRQDDGSLVVDSDVSLEDAEEHLPVPFPDAYPKHKSLSWLVHEILHRFPEDGEVIGVPESELLLVVKGKRKEHITKVQIRQASLPEDD